MQNNLNKRQLILRRALLGGAIVLGLSASSCSDSEGEGGNTTADFRSFVIDRFNETGITGEPTSINDLELDFTSSNDPQAFISLLEGN